MKLLTLASVRGAPGVTTTSLLLASTLADAPVVEADLDGGVLAVRYGLGREPGLTTFAAAGPDDEGGWRAHAQDAGEVPVLVGPDAPSASAALWRTAGERITDRLVSSDGVAVVDAGRLRSPTPIVTASDLLAILVNPVAEQLVALTHLLPTVPQAVRGQVSVVLVGDGPYRSADVEHSIGVTVLGELPDDRGAAEALRDGGASTSRLSRSRLARAVATLGSDVGASLLEPVAEVLP
jgi:hypothetical protein